MTEQSTPPWSEEFLENLNSIKNKRARAVIEHILTYGSVSTEELKEIYGYNHPPRAAKDVRDEGIPLVTYRIKGTDGRSIAAYRFGDPTAVVAGREGGRRQFSKRFKRQLYEECEGKCAICQGKFALRELQIDHRIPYEIAGDAIATESTPESYMLVCGSCNRAKLWSCEHCPNWSAKERIVCQTCYWASPITYEHVATNPVRRTEIVWQDEEARLHDDLQQAARVNAVSLQEYIKRLLKNLLLLTIVVGLLGILFLFVRTAANRSRKE